MWMGDEYIRCVFCGEAKNEWEHWMNECYSLKEKICKRVKEKMKKECLCENGEGIRWCESLVNIRKLMCGYLV